TQSFPPGLGPQPGQLYYIDTSSGPLMPRPTPPPPGTPVPPPPTPLQPTTCYPGTIGFNAARFSNNKTYVLYHLYARNDAAISYQLFVGDGVRDFRDAQGVFVRLDVHQHRLGSDFEAVVLDACTPGDTTRWCGAMPTPQVDANGILTVTL